MARIELRHFLLTRHQGAVRTELAPIEVEAMFDKHAFLRGGKGMFEQQPVRVWRVDNAPGRFQLEPFYADRSPTGLTAADVHVFGAGTEVTCVSRFQTFNWITPAMWVVVAIGLAIFALVKEGLQDVPLSAVILLIAAMAVMIWCGNCRFRLACDHDYILLYVALAIKGQRVRAPIGGHADEIAVGAA